MEPIHLNNAPIVEALIDIRCEFRNEFSVEEIKEAFLKKVEDKGFTQERDIWYYEVNNNILADNKLTSTTKETFLGYRYVNSSSTKVIQIRNDGYTFSYLKPYPTWEDFSKEARDYWSFFLELAKPSKFIRIATRFINIVELQESDIVERFSDLNNYFNSTFQLTEELPQYLAYDNHRFVIEDRDNSIIAIVNQSFERAMGMDKRRLIVDIDTYKEKQYVDDSMIWGQLNELRALKNKIFFNLFKNDFIERFK